MPRLVLFLSFVYCFQRIFVPCCNLRSNFVLLLSCGQLITISKAKHGYKIWKISFSFFFLTHGLSREVSKLFMCY